MSMRASREGRFGLTLVEVLVVITIIALLIALLIPAVNGAREASRKTTCNSNLRQIAIASVAHLELQGTFPSAGLNSAEGPNTINSTLGFHELQGGSWLYNILPYIELGHLRDVPVNQVQGTCPAVYRCPTTFSSVRVRQGDASYEGSAGTRFAPDTGGCSGGAPFHRDAPDKNGVLITVTEIKNLPPDQQEGVRYRTSGYPHAIPGLEPWMPRGNVSPYSCAAPVTGVIAPFGRVRADDVTDGMSRTFLAGERYDDMSEDPDATAVMARPWVNGVDLNSVNFTSSPPLCSLTRVSDSHREPDSIRRFGARHADSLGMVMCDGSVRQVAFTIDPAIFRDSGTRNGYNDTSMGSVDD
jgi:prepilin-type N-terminal cleavage/methylation domain-containing protein